MNIASKKLPIRIATTSSHTIQVSYPHVRTYFHRFGSNRQQEGTSKYRENILPKKPCNAGPNSKTVNDKMSIQGKTRIATIFISGCPGNSFGARHKFVPFLNIAGNLRKQGYKKTAHLLQIPVNRELLSELLRNPQS